jgi:hypothetical protein
MGPDGALAWGVGAFIGQIPLFVLNPLNGALRHLAVINHLCQFGSQVVNGLEHCPALFALGSLFCPR